MTRLESIVHGSERLSVRSKAIYASAVRSFVAFAGAIEARWSPEVVKLWLDSMKGVVAPQTVNLHLRGLRFAARRYEAMRYGANFASAIEYRREDTAKRQPKALSPAKAAALLATCPVNGTLAECRDRVVLCLGILAGLRREEMVSLLWRQWQDRKLVAVLRKGGTRQDIDLDAATDAALMALTRYGYESHSSYILRRLNVGLDGRRPTPITTGSIYDIVKARAKQAGLKVAPHELRHTFGSLALQAGVAPWRVQQAMGHADLRTTMKTYAHDIQAEEGDPVGASIGRLLKGDGDGR